MYKIAFASGKGGAGKTSFSTAFYEAISSNSIMIDCDVDASNCFILLEKTLISSTPFISGKKYSIDQKLCTGCGSCVKVCQFDAVVKNEDRYFIKDIGCEGCGACTDVCSSGAINSTENYCGDLYAAESIYGTKLYYAKLKPGEDNSGRLINELKKIAFADSDCGYAVIDAPPGTGCPLISSLSGIDMLVVVIEATESGYTDALKLLELTKGKRMKVTAIINKAGINQKLEEEIKNELEKQSVTVVGRISFNKEFYRLLREKRMVTQTDDAAIKKEIGETIKNILDLTIN